MRGGVITGGEVPPSWVARAWLERCDLIVAADAGLDAARKWGVAPDYVVGDMDSLAENTLRDLPESTLKRYDTMKDETDTELAIEQARDAGCERVVLLGGGGGRLDHLISILWLFERSAPPEAWVADKETVFLVESELPLSVNKGATVSVFPVGLGPWRMSSEGLQWPLAPLHWHRGDIGVSNVATSTEVRISLKSGRVIVIVSNEESRGW